MGLHNPQGPWGFSVCWDPTEIPWLPLSVPGTHDCCNLIITIDRPLVCLFVLTTHVKLYTLTQSMRLLRHAPKSSRLGEL